MSSDSGGDECLLNVPTQKSCVKLGARNDKPCCEGAHLCLTDQAVGLVCTVFAVDVFDVTPLQCPAEYKIAKLGPQENSGSSGSVKTWSEQVILSLQIRSVGKDGCCRHAVWTCLRPLAPEPHEEWPMQRCCVGCLRNLCSRRIR